MQPTPKKFLLHVLAYLLWLVSTAACVVALLQFRLAVAVLWAALGGNQYAIRLFNQVSLLLGGLAVLIYVIFLEGYYRESLRHRTGRPVSSGTTPIRGPFQRRSRISRWLTPSPTGLGSTKLAVLLRRFAITVAVPLGVLLLSQALLGVAWRAMP